MKTRQLVHTNLVSGTETRNAEMTEQTAQQQVSKEGNHFVAYLKGLAGKQIQWFTEKKLTDDCVRENKTDLDEHVKYST